LEGVHVAGMLDEEELAADVEVDCADGGRTHGSE
jgi:hypothetical protein